MREQVVVKREVTMAEIQASLDLLGTQLGRHADSMAAGVASTAVALERFSGRLEHSWASSPRQVEATAPVARISCAQAAMAHESVDRSAPDRAEQTLAQMKARLDLLFDPMERTSVSVAQPVESTASSSCVHVDAEAGTAALQAVVNPPPGMIAAHQLFDEVAEGFDQQPVWDEEPQQDVHNMFDAMRLMTVVWDAEPQDNPEHQMMPVWDAEAPDGSEEQDAHMQPQFCCEVSLGDIARMVEPLTMEDSDDVLTHVGGVSLFLEPRVNFAAVRFNGWFDKVPLADVVCDKELGDQDVLYDLEIIDPALTHVVVLSNFLLERVVYSGKKRFEVCDVHITDHVVNHDGLSCFLDLSFDSSDDEEWSAFSTWNWDPGISLGMLHVHLLGQRWTGPGCNSILRSVLLFQSIAHGVRLTFPWNPGALVVANESLELVTRCSVFNDYQSSQQHAMGIFEIGFLQIICCHVLDSSRNPAVANIQRAHNLAAPLGGFYNSADIFYGLVVVKDELPRDIILELLPYSAFRINSR